ncbi:hypothetical protein VTN77DRAFT_4555 [Rasamsonia byssochlamydoides]|uniref:uncharacterized protein n=1 Tax=Rasamsonia byssochlamydoides TaxID=89139 RepID=UPI0037430A4A
MADGSFSSFKDETIVRFPDEPLPASPFFRLCPEIRLTIYEHVFVLPPLEGVSYPDARTVRFWLMRFLSLLETCRTIYWEARVIPFKVNIFNLCDTIHPLWSMHCALQLLRSLRPWQAEALQGLQFCLQPDDIIGFYSFDKMTVYTQPRFFVDRINLGRLSESLFEMMLVEMGTGPNYLHVREKAQQYKTIGPLEPGSNWSEVLKDYVGKTVVISRRARLST